MQPTLDENNLPEFSRKLAKTDPDLNFVWQKYGSPPLWERVAGFPTLLHIILEQQVSLASARSAFNKLKECLGEITPEGVLSLSDAEMKSCYFSRQKTGYARDLASRILEKKIVLENLQNLADIEVKEHLKKVKGIGDWTADCYLLMALLRIDIMPKGDLALHAAYQKLKNLEQRPSAEDFLKIAEKWSPYRAVAARLLWHFYLSDKAI